ncbi:MAG: hypothetical protein ACTHJR_10935 [Sphingomonas sp.]|uniref:hypothetical protein n=1 Tax=Sphingomonas sp. TaxID=28214 RepID=UPI003F822689
MMPACPPPAPNPFRAPPPILPGRKPMLWLSSRHAGASRHLVEENASRDPDFRWGDDQANWIN